MLSGSELKDYRRKKKLKQVQLAEYSGVSVRFIKMVEQGKRKPSTAIYDKIIEAMAVLQEEPHRNSNKYKNKKKEENKNE